MLLGRDVELERLSADYEAAAHSGPMVVFVAGERGIGKTRLLAEFAARLGVLAASERPLVIQVRNRWEVGAVYRPCERLVEALGWRARYQWNGAARPRGAASYLLTGGEDGAAQAVSALAQVCDRMSVVLLIDDWDWADPDEGPSLVRLVAGSKGLPVMFVVAGRKVEPSLFGLDPEIAVRHLRLQPLTESQSCQLVQQHPASSALPPDAIEALVRRGGGNPAHLLESIEALIDEGTLTASGDGWVVREGQALDAVPESLRNGVLSRLDTLPPAAKELVRLCAVLGENLAPRVLAELAGQSVEDVGRAMEAVVEAGLMWPEESEGGYRFRSPLVREVAYDTMLRRHRAELHRRVGLYLEAAGTADVEALALHSVKGGLAEQAARYGPAAGERLLHWGRPQEAAALLSELESLMGDYPPEERARVQELLAQAYVSQGACQAGLERLLDALGSVRDPAWRARLMREVGWAHAIDGRPDLAMRHYQQARELAASTANEGEWAMVAASMRLLYDRP
jgi:tetratricopeptide (TPR) repeat protein